jgi:hypothetical protein
MSVGYNRLASLLEEAAENIANVSREDLQALLRRAALMLRNIQVLDKDTDDDNQHAVDWRNPDPEGPVPGQAAPRRTTMET